MEELFDLSADPWEVNNLAAETAHVERMQKMRLRLKQVMIKTRDTGLVPEPMFATLSPNKPIADYIEKRSEDLPALVELAFTASERNLLNLPSFISKLSSTDPLARYWAAQGVLILGKDAKRVEPHLFELLKDGQSAIRVAAAQALHTMGQQKVAAAALKAGSERY